MDPTDLHFERLPPKLLRLLPIWAWSLLLIVVPGVLVGIGIGLDWFTWLHEEGGVPVVALAGTLVAGVFLSALLATVFPLLMVRRFGSCHLRGDLLTFDPSDVTIPREDVTGWRRLGPAIAVHGRFHPQSKLIRPLLIPTQTEDELAQALRWLEDSQPPPVEEGAEEPPHLPLVKLDARDALLPVGLLFALLTVLPLIGGLRFGSEVAVLAFALGSLSSTFGSLIVYLLITRHSLRAWVGHEALLIGVRRHPLKEVVSISLTQGALALERLTPGGKRKRVWTALPAGRSAELRGDLETALTTAGKPGLLSAELPSWARETPRRGLARLSALAILLTAIAGFSLPLSVYGAMGARLGIYGEVHLRDDDGHVLTLLYQPGQPQARFVYLSSEGFMGGVVGYQVRVPGLFGNPGYGLSFGSDGREVDVADGHISEATYRRPLDTETKIALRVGPTDWRTTFGPLPKGLVLLAKKLDEEDAIDSLPAALAPLLDDPDCPALLREFVQGRTSWRVHEVSDAQGVRIVAIVLQGRVRTLALLPPDQLYTVHFAILRKKGSFYRSLIQGANPPPPSALVLTKKEDGQLCWPRPKGWATSPTGTIELDPLLAVLGRVKAGEIGSREALAGLLGAAWPTSLPPETSPR
ncbi:MAG: magnesium transporter [Planctomycetes bacterium]|nr:magnesium transporter [Planctomycetota bacterium]